MSAAYWVGQRQEYWQELAQDLDFPLWQRVLFAAWGNVGRNRHAPFVTGGLAEAVAVREHVLSPEGVTVELPPRPPNDSDLRAAIRKLKAKGLLNRESNVRCLVLPAADVHTGPGSSHARCLIHA